MNIEKWFLFHNIEKNIIDEIVSNHILKITYPKNSIITSKDSPLKKIVFIEKGTLKVDTEQGMRKFLFEGDSFGVAGLFNKDHEFFSTISTVKDSTLCFLDEQDLLKLLNSNQDIALNYIRFLSEKIGYLNSQVDLFRSKDIASKLYTYLLDNMDTNNEVKVPNMQRLSTILSVGRASLYRAFDKLQNSHLIIKNEQTIIILQN